MPPARRRPVAQWPLIRRSLVRSRVRVRTLLALLRCGPMYAAELAREALVSSQKLHGALHGDGDDFDPELALLRLRLVCVHSRDAFGVRYELTALGRGVAKAWQQRLVTSWIGASTRAPA